MGLNWVEDLVAHLFKVRGYLVIENEDLQLPRTEDRAIRGHSDIDILAINDNEIIHIECQSWWGPAKADEGKQFKRLIERFENSPNYIFTRYPFLKIPGSTGIRKIFVTSGKPKRSTGRGPWDRLAQFCLNNGIELWEIDEVITKLIQELKKRYPRPQEIGKEEGIARFLLHLILRGFISNSSIKGDD